MHYFNRTLRALLCVVLAAGLCLPAGLAFAEESASDTLPAGDDRPAPETDEGSEPDQESVQPQESGSQDPQVQGDAAIQPASDADSAVSADEGTVVGSAITDEQIADALAGLEGPDSAAISLFSVPEAASVVNSGVVSLAGETQYDTAAAEALYAFKSSEYVIAASGTSAVDALSATALAGLLDCPILLTAKSYVPQATKDAIKSLGVKNVVVIGGTAVISDSTASALGEASSSGTYTRLAGESLFDTQLAIYEYGKKHGTWGNTAFVANGVLSFADALSVSPLAFKLKAPVFLADSKGMLPVATARALIGGGFKQVVVAGGTAVVSDECWGVFQAASIMGGGDYDCVERLAGKTLYDTSAAIAEWAVSKGYLAWNGAAFATGRIPYDALAGSVVQGKEGSVLLLVDEGYSACVDAVVAADAKKPVEMIKFFGGTAVITPEQRLEIAQRLDLSNITLTERSYPITMSRFVDIEYAQANEYHGYTRAQIKESMDPASTPAGTAGFYQFTVLSDGYSGMTAEQLDAFIAANCRYSERNYGVTSNLRGTGAYFVEAAKTYGINEVYLLAHAALESAWGCSALAQGTIKGYSGYLNFYGIGAYDIDPGNGGAAMAKKYGWTDPRKAILGAAEWLSKNYINPTVSSGKVSGPQDTLWKMRWDVQRAASEESVWHQYATGRTWATGIATVMAEFYSSIDLPFEKTGLTFEIPKFS